MTAPLIYYRISFRHIKAKFGVYESKYQKYRIFDIDILFRFFLAKIQRLFAYRFNIYHPKNHQIDNMKKIIYEKIMSQYQNN